MISQKRVAGYPVHRRRDLCAALLLLCLLCGLSAAPVRAENRAHISLSVQDAELRQVLHQLAAAVRLNLVLSEGVQGRISLQVRQQPPLAVLDSILQVRGLGREQVGDSVLVASLEELTARARQAREWEQAREAREPVETRLLPLQHARAGELAKMFEAGAGAAGERLLGPRGRLEVDLRTNTLLLTDNAMRLARWPAWLAALDRPGRQVVIETRLAAVSRTRAQQLGVQWRLQRPDMSALVPLAAGGADVSVLTYGLIGLDGKALDLALSALESDGEGEVIARPSVMTAEQQMARISSGQQIPYQETTHSGASTTRFVNAELSLEVTPAIAPDGEIALDLKLSHDSPGEIQPSGARAIETNRLATQVRLLNGQTLMLGGIFRTQVVNSVSKVPGLGNIPLLGYLFRRHVMREDKQELLIFVTPRLVADSAAVTVAEMADGSDSSQHISGRADGRRQDHDWPPAGRPPALGVRGL